MKNLKTIIEQIQTGTEYVFQEHTIKELIGNFEFNLSLHYPDKATLPLNEFSQFYFKDLTDLRVKDKMTRAYNDTIASCLQTIFTPTKDGYKSLSHFREINEPIVRAYFEKAIFSKFFVNSYLHSKKTAREILESDKTTKYIIDRELSKYLHIK
jgi:hypothetical protein